MAETEPDWHAVSPHAFFGGFEESRQENQMAFIAQNIGWYELFEQLTGFQIRVQSEVSKRRSECASRRTGRPTNDILTEIFLSGMLHQNTGYLFSAWRALEHDLLHVCGSLMRNAVESVPKPFYLLANPHAVKKFKLGEAHLAYKSKNPPAKNLDSATNFLKSPYAQKILDGEQIAPKKFLEFVYGHKHLDICEKIYGKDTLQLQRELYSMLSASSHASMSRFATPSRDPVLEGRFANMLTDLSFFSLFLTINSQHRLLRDAGLARGVERCVKGAWHDLGSPDPLTDMYPDGPEYPDCLEIKLPP